MPDRGLRGSLAVAVPGAASCAGAVLARVASRTHGRVGGAAFEVGGAIGRIVANRGRSAPQETLRPLGEGADDRGDVGPLWGAAADDRLSAPIDGEEVVARISRDGADGPARDGAVPGLAVALELERAPVLRSPEMNEREDALGAVARRETNAHRELGQDLLARDVLDRRIGRPGIRG